MSDSARPKAFARTLDDFSALNCCVSVSSRSAMYVSRLSVLEGNRARHVFTVVLDLHASSPNLRRFRSFLRIQLKRSRTYPINVEVLLYFDKVPVGNDNALDIRGLLQDLVTNRHRWRQASISVSTSVNLIYRVCPKEMLYWKN